MTIQKKDDSEKENEAVNSKKLYIQKAGSPEAAYREGGLRSFFVYRTTEMEKATSNQLRCIFVKAAKPAGLIPNQQGTGEHFHVAEGTEKGFHAVLVTKGWLQFRYDGKETRVEAGDIVHQPIADKDGGGVRHVLYDWSFPVDAEGHETGEPAAEYIEFTSPGFGTCQITPSGTAMDGPKP